MIVEQAFGRLKNRFRILLTAQRAHAIRARNNAFAAMVLHNILNRRGTLYLQAWDERTARETVYNEVPGTNAAGHRTPDGATAGRRITMGAIRDQIRLDLCS